MTTKDKILEAARKEFLENGYDGTRMRSIADRADINKGLLHYYFKTKESLMVEVFHSTFQVLFTALGNVFQSDLSIEEKVRAGVDAYMSFMARHPKLPLFIISEMNRDPKRHVQRLKKAKVKPPFGVLITAINEGKSRGEVRADLTPEEFMATMMSLMLFPFVGKSMIKFIHDMTEAQYEAFIEQRKADVAATLIRSITP